MPVSSSLRHLPRVDDLVRTLSQQHPAATHSTLTAIVRAAINDTRRDLLDATLSITDAGALQLEVLCRAQAALQKPETTWPPRILNATGIIIHTGLGRALLSDAAVAAAHMAAADACALEVEVESGARGRRDYAIAALLREITGCEDATVCNNGAGATLLALSTLAAGREVICSRGELVEIGGGFRMPDVMRQSGAQLREVGCTNKVRLADYAAAINDQTGALLKVHTSNYRIVGFTEEVSLHDLAQLGRERGLPVMEDLGSGVLLDLAAWGLPGEPTVQERVGSGADVVVFSGDKLLGGPQAGILCGRKQAIEEIRRHPLMRALRCDKMTLAALETTLRHYRNPDDCYAVARREIPTLRAITAPATEVQRRARKLQRLLKGVPAEVTVRPSQAQAGAGALPTQTLPSWAVVIQIQTGSVEELARQLRIGTPGVWGYLREAALWLDLRTLRESEIAICAQAISQALASK